MKTTLYIASSLDGFIAGPGDDLSFLSAVEREGEDYGYKAFVATVDAVIMGRKTYDKVLSFGIEFPHKGLPVYVLSRSRNGRDENVTYVEGDLTLLFQELRAKGIKHIYCDGGAAMVKELMKMHLIDEIVLSIIPVLLGKGVRLFQEGIGSLAFGLQQVKTFESGLVQLHYSKVKAKSL